MKWGGYAACVAAPVAGVCNPWITGADLDASCCADLAKRASAATFSVNVLFRLSGRQYPGLCQRTIRPCGVGCAAWARWPAYRDAWWPAYLTPGGGWTGGAPSLAGCGCNNRCRLPSITLPGPVAAVTEVVVDGVILDPSAYQVVAYRRLERLDGGTWPCFTEDVLIWTEKGLRKIADVEVGEKVLTHRGRWRRVLRAGKTGDSETVTLKGRGGSLRCTPEHLVWTREALSIRVSRNSKQVKLGAPTWTEASNAVGQLWAMPTRADELPVNLPDAWTTEDVPGGFWWVVGRWLGDGWTSAGNGGDQRVTICCSHAEADELAGRLAGTPWSWHRSDERTAVKFRTQNAGLRRWLRDQFGTGALDKRMPGWVLGAPETVRRELLDGYMSADGCLLSPQRGPAYMSATSVSKPLALSVSALAATLGRSPKVYVRETNSDTIEGRPVTVRPSYRVDWSTEPTSTYSPQSWPEEDHLWGRVKSATFNELVVPVYDLEVEEDHSFIADGFVVHNCSQNLAADSGVGGDPGTFQVTFTYGRNPDGGGILAAAEYACEVAKYLCGASGSDCRLPQRTRSVIRQGVSFDITSPLDFLDKGRTGISLVDGWLASVNPARLQRRATVRRFDSDVGASVPSGLPPVGFYTVAGFADQVTEAEVEALIAANPDLVKVTYETVAVSGVPVDGWYLHNGTLATFTGRDWPVIWEGTAAQIPAQGAGAAQFQTGDLAIVRSTTL